MARTSARFSRRSLLATPALLSVHSANAQTPAAIAIFDTLDWTLHDPVDVGVPPGTIERVHELIQEQIDRDALAGAVTAITRHGKLIFHEAQGWRDVIAQHPMELDTLFMMMSSTKPVTAVAVMIAAEQGLLSIDDPVSRYIPWFADLRVANPQAGFDLTLLNPTARTRSARQSTFEAAESEVTIKHLLTHTAGFATNGAGQWVIGHELPLRTSLAERIDDLAGMELDFQPGSQWSYSPLHGFDVLLRIVEIVSGQSAEEFMAERIFKPLGMAQTTFGLPLDQQDRMASIVFRINDEWQTLEDLTDMLSIGGEPILDAPPGVSTEMIGFSYPSGSAGLVSNARDFLQFEQMLVNGGSLNGVRVLSSESVAEMSMNHVGDLFSQVFGLGSPDTGFGLGVKVVTHSDGPGSPAKGLFGWGGALGTETWADPENGYAVAILVHQPSGDLVREIQGVLNHAE